MLIFYKSTFQRITIITTSTYIYGVLIIVLGGTHVLLIHFTTFSNLWVHFISLLKMKKKNN